MRPLRQCDKKLTMDYLQSMVDFVLHIDVHMTEMVALYGVWIYAILFVIIFCETGLVVTPFLPGDSLLFMAGALASLPTNPVNVHLLVLMLIAAAVLGDATNYMIGRSAIPIPKSLNRATWTKPTISTTNMEARPLFWPVLFRSYEPLPPLWPVWDIWGTVTSCRSILSAVWRG